VRAAVEHELAPRNVEELREALIAHGLPTSIYGYDKPQLTLDGPPVIEAAEPDEGSKINGSGAQNHPSM
jgi:hypothetical protein